MCSQEKCLGRVYVHIRTLNDKRQGGRGVLERTRFSSELPCMQINDD